MAMRNERRAFGATRGPRKQLTTTASCALALSLITSVGAAGAEMSLVQAVKAGDRNAVRTLLKRGPADVAEADGTTALHWAVRADDLETARLLIRAGANVKATNRHGMTPLALAALNGSATMIEALVKAGADPNAALPEGETVVMTAARTGRPDALRVLLANGGNPNATEAWLGENALMWAAAENHAEAVRLLVESGADPNARSAPVSFTVTQPTFTVRTKLPRGGWTPLMYAARQGSLDAARALARAGANLNLTDPDGTSPLVLAIINAHYDLAAALLEEGADPNVADQGGMAALYATVDMHTQQWMFGRPIPKLTGQLTPVDLVSRLLARGANPNARLTRPMLMRHHDAGDPTLGDGATPFIRAAKTGDVAVMRLLLAAGADPHLRLRNHATALMIAAGVGWRDARGDGPRVTPITEAGSIEAITLCLELGLDVDAFNDDGDTAVHGAALRGADRVVAFLAERKAKLDSRNRTGATPLDVAANRRETGIAVHAPRASTAALLRRLAGSSTVDDRKN
jgi:ankyrin repeat protein